MDVHEKVKMAQKGDDNAFYELINEKKSMLYKIAFTYVNNKEDALDILSETVYKAYISIKGLKNEEFFNTWLTRILINCSMDFLRKNKKTISLKEEISEGYNREENNDEESIDLHVAVDKLNGKYKTIVILKYFQGMTLQEISEVLSCPLGTVKTNLNKALSELRLTLKEGEIL